MGTASMRAKPSFSMRRRWRTRGSRAHGRPPEVPPRAAGRGVLFHVHVRAGEPSRSGRGARSPARGVPASDHAGRPPRPSTRVRRPRGTCPAPRGDLRQRFLERPSGARLTMRIPRHEHAGSDRCQREECTSTRPTCCRDSNGRRSRSGVGTLPLLLERLQRGEDLPCIPRSPHRILLQHAAHELTHAGLVRHFQRWRRPWSLYRSPAVVGERKLTREHPVEDDPQGEHVRALVLGRTAPLLGGHVRWRAAFELSSPEGVSHAEIEQLHLAVVAQEDVSRREVAMHHPCAWACASPRDVETDAQRFAKRDRTELQPCERACCRGAAPG